MVGLLLVANYWWKLGNKDKGTWLPSVCGSRSCCQGVIQCDIWWLVAVKSLLSWVQLHPVTAICVCSCCHVGPSGIYLLTIDQAVIWVPGYPVRVPWQWSCYHGGLEWCFAILVT